MGHDGARWGALLFLWQALLTRFEYRLLHRAGLVTLPC
jgi:hypothetical protein